MTTDDQVLYIPTYMVYDRDILETCIAGVGLSLGAVSSVTKKNILFLHDVEKLTAIVLFSYFVMRKLCPILQI